MSTLSNLVPLSTSGISDEISDSSENGESKVKDAVFRTKIKSEVQRIRNQYSYDEGFGLEIMVIWNPSRPSISPLVMGVNPSQMGMGFSKRLSRANTLGGYVEESWGDNPIMINCSGSTLGFFTTDKDRIEDEVKKDSGNSQGTGEELSYIDGRRLEKVLGTNPGYRRETFAYRNFQKILEYYKYNGLIQEPVYGRIHTSEPLRIEWWDGSSFDGKFRAFNYTEAAETPFRFTYDFTFAVYKSRMIVR